MSFTNLFLWGESRAHLFADIDGHLVMSFQKRDQERIWYPPVGPDPARIIRDVLVQSDVRSMLYIEEPLAMQLKDAGVPVQEEPARFDYVYTLSDLRELPGTKYASHRNKIRRCAENKPGLIALNASLHDECMALFQQWKETQEPSPSLVDEESALDLALKNYKALELHGIGVRIKGKLEAFGIGAFLNADTMVETFEKSSNAYVGLYQFVLHEFAKSVPAPFAFLNREENMGLPGLKAVKEGWHPEKMVKKYSLKVS